MVADAPIACTTLETTSIVNVLEIPQSNDPIAKSTSPHLNTVVFPFISPSLPKTKIVAEITIR
ncbi:hypothetical protein SDC9_151737 [bioreactor metagenome]|uniref:Uncharacterized protein n=1 Tax=bioreactor metagenome TaxID=1076179 RepID=A0A645EST8_9ZZZZ